MKGILAKRSSRALGKLTTGQRKWVILGKIDLLEAQTLLRNLSPFRNLKAGKEAKLLCSARWGRAQTLLRNLKVL